MKNYIYKLGLLLAAVFTLSSTNVVLANEEEAAEVVTLEAPETAAKEGKYKPTNMILHHVGDANHFTLLHGINIPLPCIMYNVTTKTLATFMSNNHEAMEAAGYHMHHDRIKPVQEGQTVIDFSVTRNVVGLLIAAVLLLVIFFSIKKSYVTRKGQAPKGLQSLLEPIILFVRDDVAKQSLGDRADYYMPYLMTVFFFIWMNNMLGLIPILGSNVTGNIAVTLVLALITGFIINIKANKAYWKHILLPEPLFLAPILVPIELLSIITKPVTLMVRLFANILAGHIIVLSLISLIFIFGKAAGDAMESQSIGGVAAGAAVAIPFTIFISVIELLVAFVQAFIFTMLSAVFIGMATEEHHAHPAHEAKGHH
jgi:F-type H+-transporting ATPase subunit a